MPTSNRTACRRPLLAPLGGPGRGLLAQRGVCCWQTLLRKSVTADGCPSAIRLLTTGFDLPALTLVTQLQRYAIHGAGLLGLFHWTPVPARKREFSAPEVAHAGPLNRHLPGVEADLAQGSVIKCEVLTGT